MEQGDPRSPVSGTNWVTPTWEKDSHQGQARFEWSSVDHVEREDFSGDNPISPKFEETDH